jgi:hypothetical protein
MIRRLQDPFPSRIYAKRMPQQASAQGMPAIWRLPFWRTWPVCGKRESGVNTAGMFETRAALGLRFSPGYFANIEVVPLILKQIS